jgi:hypothetical protein
MDAHPGSGRITLDLRRLTSGKRNARPGVAGALTKIVDKFQAKYSIVIKVKVRFMVTASI